MLKPLSVAAAVVLVALALLRHFWGPDLQGMLAGLGFGLLAGLPTALLVLLTSRRPPTDEDDGDEWGDLEEPTPQATKPKAPVDPFRADVFVADLDASLARGRL